MVTETPFSKGFSAVHVRIISELFQDRQEAVRRFEAFGLVFRRLEFAQATLFHLHVQFDVVVRGGWRFMSQQQRNEGTLS